MLHTAKLFMDGRDQAVELPDEFRFDGGEIYSRRDLATGDVILSPKANTSRETPTPANLLTR